MALYGLRPKISGGKTVNIIFPLAVVFVVSGKINRLVKEKDSSMLCLCNKYHFLIGCLICCFRGDKPTCEGEGFRH